MLGGEFRHTLDSKGRVSMPAKFRNELGGKFVVSKGLGEKCLYVFALTEWYRLLKKVEGLPLTDAKARQFTRFFIGGASECEIDGQGRVMLPVYLREYAGLEKDVVFIGAGSRAEIWDGDEWNRYTSPESGNMDDVFESMREMGI